MQRFTLPVLSILLFSVACGDDSSSSDSGVVDAARRDAARADAFRADAFRPDGGGGPPDGAPAGDTGITTRDGGLTDASDGGAPVDATTDGAPSCLMEDPGPPPDAGEIDPTPPYIEGACAPMGFGDVPVEATLRFGDETFALGRACAGPYDAEDTMLNTFHGYHFTLAPAGGCSPLLSVITVDTVRYGDPPVDIDLTESLCPDSAMHNTSIHLRLGERRYLPQVGAPGTHHVESFDPLTGATVGSIDVALVEVGTAGPPVAAHLDYRIGAGKFLAGIMPLFITLCAPEE
jgi:hypothetical protein